MCTIVAQKLIAVLLFEGQNTRALKRFVCELLRFLLRRGFCHQNWYYVAQLLHLFNLHIFFITMSQDARKRKSQGGTSMQASKRTLQASVLSVHCLQINENPRD